MIRSLLMGVGIAMAGSLFWLLAGDLAIVLVPALSVGAIVVGRLRRGVIKTILRSLLAYEAVGLGSLIAALLLRTVVGETAMLLVPAINVAAIVWDWHRIIRPAQTKTATAAGGEPS